MSEPTSDEGGTTLVIPGEVNRSGAFRLKPGPKPAGKVTDCATCGEAKNDGRTECGRCRAQRYRDAHPERDRANKRAYKERQRAFTAQMERTAR